MNDNHEEDHNTFNESNVDVDDKLNEDNNEDDDFINEEPPEKFRTSSKFYSTMKSRIPAQGNRANFLEDRNKHHQLPETMISLIVLMFLLTKHKVDKKLFEFGAILTWARF